MRSEISHTKQTFEAVFQHDSYIVHGLLLPKSHVREKSYVNMRHLFLMRSLEKVAGEAEGENGNWKIKLIIFVGGTSGSTGECTDFVFERELFIGTQFSILYTSVYPPVKGRVSMIVLRNFKSWSPKKCNQKRFGL